MNCKEWLSYVDFIYIHIGHGHFKKVVITKMAKIEMHGNLNTLDAWAYSKGYRNMLAFESECIIYSEHKGEISRVNYNNFSV